MTDHRGPGEWAMRYPWRHINRQRGESATPCGTDRRWGTLGRDRPWEETVQRIVIRIDFTESATPLARWGSSCLDQAGEVGSPIHGIAIRTEAVGHDLVVVGSRGLGDVRREVLGGVTSGVLRAAWCPVLVV